MCFSSCETSGLCVVYSEATRRSALSDQPVVEGFNGSRFNYLRHVWIMAVSTGGRWVVIGQPSGARMSGVLLVLTVELHPSQGTVQDTSLITDVAFSRVS
jgi:hypothetical protein